MGMKLWELLSPTPRSIAVEALNDVQSWAWVKPQGNADVAKIALGDRVFWVWFHRKNDGVSITFNDDDHSEEVTGKGSAFQVFATVGDIIKNYIGSHHPERIYFHAKEASRQKLYAKLAALIAKATGAEVDERDDPHWGVGYYLDFRGEAYESLHEDGKIIPNVNTTVDVQPGETNRQAEKFGNKLDAKGRPPLLSGSYGDDTARFSAIQGDPFYGSDGTRLPKNKKWS